MADVLYYNGYQIKYDQVVKNFNRRTWWATYLYFVIIIKNKITTNDYTLL